MWQMTCWSVALVAATSSVLQSVNQMDVESVDRRDEPTEWKNGVRSDWSGA